MSDLKLTLKPADVAGRLGVSRWAASQLMETGQLRAVRKGRGSQAHWRTCERWLAEFESGRGQSVGNAPVGAGPRVSACPVRGLQYTTFRDTVAHGRSR